MSTGNVTVRVVIFLVVDEKKESWKKYDKRKKKLVNLVTPIAQTTKMAKSTLKRERKNDEVNIGKKAFVPRISQKKSDLDQRTKT